MRGFGLNQNGDDCIIDVLTSNIRNPSLIAI